MKTVFFDIDTQIDFVYPAGALYVPGAEHILPVIGELNRRAPLLISTMDAHSEDDPEFQIYPHHCVVGTTGQHKPAITLLDQRARSAQAVPVHRKAETRLFQQPASASRCSRGSTRIATWSTAWSPKSACAAPRSACSRPADRSKS